VADLLGSRGFVEQTQMVISSSRSRLLVGRFAVTAALVAFAALTYLLLVVGLGWLLGLPAEQPSLVLSVLATVVVAVGLEPARRRLRPALGAAGEDQLIKITSELSGAMSAEEVLPRTARAVAEATKARAVEIRVEDPGADPIVSRWPADAFVGSDEPGAVVRPIVSDASLIGELVLRPKLTRSGRSRRFTQAEQRLLDELVARAGLMVANMQLQAALRREVAVAAQRAEEVRTSRRRVVEVSDAERHRLERNIHDGAQQHLVALSVSLGLARAQCDSDSTGAVATLEALVPAVRRTLAELDDLGRGIYPQALIVGGVADALTALATNTSPAVTLTVPQPKVRWPRELESAVYFTCAEAIQNATKHASASRVEVCVAATSAEVSFEVRDDGQGFELPRDDVGTGLSGMRDRVEALGGVLVVSSAPGRGTTVRGQLPLPRMAG
jgi:signal transduction histidine kinase